MPSTSHGLPVDGLDCSFPDRVELQSIVTARPPWLKQAAIKLHSCLGPGVEKRCHRRSLRPWGGGLKRLRSLGFQ
jgi:hypothetical protein